MFWFILTAPSIFCQWHHPLFYVSLHHRIILYLCTWVVCSTICSTTYDFVLGDSVVTLVIIYLCRIIDQCFICDTWTWFWLVLSGSDQMIHYVFYIFHLYLYTFLIFSVIYMWTCFSFTEHGYAYLRHELSLWSLSLVFWQAKMWWSPL